MADVAQLVERRFVVPVAAGSIPVVRPSRTQVSRWTRIFWICWKRYHKSVLKERLLCPPC